MRLQDAQEIVHELEGKSYHYLKQWGLPLAREAVRTIRDRKTAPRYDKAMAERVGRVIFWRYL